MSTTATRKLYPTSLREHLDKGGTFEGFDPVLIEWMAEVVVHDRRLFGMEHLARDLGVTLAERSALHQELIEEGRSRGVSEEALRKQEAQFALEELFRRWEEELGADEELCERAEKALPPDLVAEMLDTVKAEKGQPYRLGVQHLDSYRCTITGETNHGPAIVVEATASGDRRALKESGVDEMVFSPAAVEAALRLAQADTKEGRE